MGFPWLGETMEFYKAQTKNKLYHNFVEPRLAKYGNVFKTRLMGSPTVVVNGADANRFFLSNEFKLVISSWPSSSVQLMGKNSIMEKQGEQHKCLRSLISTSIGFSGLLPKISSLVKSHLNSDWLGKDQISLYRSTKVLTFKIVFECLLGIKVEAGMLEMFERVLEGVFAPAINFPGSKFGRAKKARQEIEEMLRKIVREKRNEMDTQGECGDEMLLMKRLVAEMIHGRISEKEVIDNVVLLVFAAHDTTSFAIAMTFKMMAKHPHCYQRVLKEHVDIKSSKGADADLTMEDIKKMKYTWQVARESMRLFPPIFGSFRKAITDIEYEGFIIPKGWKILWTAYGTHYNEEYFQDPWKFDPSRFDEPAPLYSFLPFGGGPRICAGYPLAKLNILVLVHHVVTLFDWSLVYPDEEIAMDPLPFPSRGMPFKISHKN
ncbi:hypothetical protein ACFE04_020739 [Oxalis oulophora]